tara:strand:+ start:401 stop:2602 length:2202 start_codon:yes stop_codon:yes gene_type:complete
MKNIRVKYILCMAFFFLVCEKEESPNNSSLTTDCAGVPEGTNICGCTDSTAYNYNSDATYDDGSCQSYLDQGDYYLSFNGSNSSVEVGDIMPQGSYTKAAWVKRQYGYQMKHNIISGNANHVFWIPQSQGAKLSAGHQGDFSIVQDTDSIPEHIWTFVSVTYDAVSSMMTLYKNNEQVDQATGVPLQDESTATFIGRFGNGNNFYGDIDEVALWNTALTAAEISEVSQEQNDMNATLNRGSYESSNNLIGYWKMNEGDGDLLSDASGNGNTGAITYSQWSTCDECGCMDESACNYDPSATIDNRSCDYVDKPCETCVDSKIIIDDHDADTLCDDSDEDDDNDNVPDVDDLNPFDNTVCSDIDEDGCDDCSSGVFNTSNDGPDDDGDGICNEYLIEGRTVYIVGSSYNDAGNMTTCYWVDGSRVELPGGAWATDIVVVDGDVYTCGTGEASDACYWINDVRYDLPGTFGEAEAIAVHNGDVYVAGWYDNGSCYWKNGQRIDLTVNRDSQAFAIAIKDNGTVYVGGYYMNNHHYIIPCFWKSGGNRTNLAIPSGGDGEVYDMALEDGNMRYFAGYVLHTSSFAGYRPTASYWRHTSRTDLRFGGSNMDIYGAETHGITIDRGEVYTAGRTDWFGLYGDDSEFSGGYFPQYWKGKKIYDLEGGPLGWFGTGDAYDIRVADENIIVVGVATRDNYLEGEMSACYWFNGELNYLVKQGDVPADIDDWYWSEAKGLHIE